MKTDGCVEGYWEVKRGSDARLRATELNGCRCEWFMKRVFVIERV